MPTTSNARSVSSTPPRNRSSDRRSRHHSTTIQFTKRELSEELINAKLCYSLAYPCRLKDSDTNSFLLTNKDFEGRMDQVGNSLDELLEKTSQGVHVVQTPGDIVDDLTFLAEHMYALGDIFLTKGSRSIKCLTGPDPG